MIFNYTTLLTYNIKKNNYFIIVKTRSIFAIQPIVTFNDSTIRKLITGFLLYKTDAPELNVTYQIYLQNEVIYCITSITSISNI